ncbi:hypothetical protein BRC2024_QFGIOCBO_CDS_0074 [Acinetobacter phage vB_AbaM_PhT2-v2]
MFILTTITLPTLKYLILYIKDYSQDTIFSFEF